MIDPRLSLLRRALHRRPAVRLPRLRGLREAAVALVLRPGDGLELLLIRRAEHERDPWSGHMALPGGRREPGDASLRATAERETEEETGVELDRIGEPLGELDEVGTRNPQLPRLVIAPFVAAVPARTRAEPRSHEVDTALWIPVDALRDDRAISRIEIDGGRSFESLEYGEHVIWGLTHRILTHFLRLLDACEL